MRVLSAGEEKGQRAGRGDKRKQRSKRHGMRSHYTPTLLLSLFPPMPTGAADLWPAEHALPGFTIHAGLSVFSNYLLLPSLMDKWSETVNTAIKLPFIVSKFGLLENLLCILHDTLYNYSCKNMSQKTDQEGTELKTAKASGFILPCLAGFYSGFLPDCF